MEVYLVYKTDNWHSYKSRDTIGVATSQAQVIKLCKAQAKKEGHTIAKDQLWNLDNLNQTQGYEGEGEFHYEAMKTNTLI